jgi:ribosome biogenesis protein ENP2
VLTDDFSKLAFLGVNTYTIYFHAKFGDYHFVKVPGCARVMKYDRSTCDLFLAGAAPVVWRFNLEAGRFLPSLTTDLTDVGAISIAERHSLYALGGSEDEGMRAVLEMRDPRAPQTRPIGRLDLRAQLAARGEVQANAGPFGVTSVDFHADGLHVGVGTGSGHALLYDLRAAQPLFVKDHRNELPIHSVRFDGQHCFSADSKVIKVWDYRTGASFTNIETDAPSTDVLVFPDSGVVFATGEQQKVMAYYCPALGKAPRWCSFLDNITEELEERKRSTQGDEIFENFKFLTREDLSAIGGDNLIGTKFLRRYMHGFFMSSKLYKKMLAAMNPNALEDYRKSLVAERMAQMHESRIAGVVASKKRSTSNSGIRELKEDGDEDDNQAEDERFRSVRENPDFAIEDDFVPVTGEKKRRTDGVKMYEARDKDVLDDAGDVKLGKRDEKAASKKKKLTLGERAKELAASGALEAQAKRVRERPKVSNLEEKFLPKEVVERAKQKQQEKKERIEHNKTRRKAGRLPKN